MFEPKEEEAILTAPSLSSIQGQSPLNKERKTERQTGHSPRYTKICIIGCVFSFVIFESSISQTTLCCTVESLYVADIAVRKIEKYMLLKNSSVNSNYYSRNIIRKNVDKYVFQCTLK